ncbi:isoleucine--tRNA ligase [Buchnera aphidicola]|uniref:Isoleucine--tRNA ligase n=1 Tax=Buchnera aphidicola subsp. Cinara cedri (strain Cc) TaxID=372461 RepID=SYI_BUCCC|nr:isoleucine--tRNA ligase [Buchnera aphidicola]Q057X9.1 RecName: Full=Isoleucine--tRNA ligase; AltName: Full=Isoleucyl-tRNA synthetase; Short=IleRS [Buchnera aphidicola BCc]ABJ90570.1 isoleucyl-tRNA synthetase [Buchnera aphidicola BCc]
MINIKKSLNLPKTKFPMKANLAYKENEILETWKKINLYNKLHKNKKKNKQFFLQDGPPYANGNIHIGHAVNKILKDIILKFKRMSGFFSPYIPCWDCHGLPIEHIIEKKLSKKKINKKEFRKICFKYVLKQVEKQKNDFIRLGIIANWDNINLSTDYINQSNTIKVLTKIVEKGLIYRDLKPVYWCFDCQSALAEAEIEYKFKKSISIYIEYKLIENSILKNNFFKNYNKKIFNNISILIFTTTPWTIPTCQAIAINPKLYYQIIKINKKYYICIEELTKKIFKKNNIKKWKIILSFKGKEIEHIKCFHPFLNTQIPIILSKHVSNQLGTGAVHMSPDHGYEDFIACKKYKIIPKQIVDSHGFYKIKKYSQLNNIHIFNKENKIIYILKKNKKLFFFQTINHNYPHCWRHKKPIIFRATPQWFINLSKKNFKEDTFNKIKKILWIPSWGKNKMKKMLKIRPDWCISRQRIWGIPLPFFIHKNTGELHPNTVMIMKKIVKKIRNHGYKIWWESNVNTWIKKDSETYRKVNDVLDVWFESGANHQLKIYKHNIKNKKNYVADLYLEGSDQHRGWFMSSLIISMITKTIPPYLSVITHGFVLDKNGQKMSKSLNNNISPKKIIQKKGADILRLWVAYTNYTNDISISNEILEQISDNYRRIRNTIRFLFSNIFDFKANIHIIKYEKMLFLDQWIIEKTYNYQRKIIKKYSQYQFHKVIKKIINFCSIELGSCYLELIKDRQYTMHKNSIERRSSQTAIFYILQFLVRWIAPILSFTAEEIWSQLQEKKEKSIFMTQWYKNKQLIKKKSTYNLFFWKKIFAIRKEINLFIETEKKNKFIKNSLEIILLLYINKKLFNFLLLFNNELKFIFLVSETQLHKYSSAPSLAIKSKKIKKFKILIKKSKKIKCPRCWNYTKKNNFLKNKNSICNKCIKNINQTNKKHIFL